MHHVCWLRNALRAYKQGLVDGLEQPCDLTSGMTYTDWRLSEIYDRGVNVGQRAGRVLIALRSADV